MANITIDGQPVECADGATLLEVCKAAGVYVSSLCYIDGLPPYAGCRTCLVEIEGARGLQLSCTTKVTDGMAVRSRTSDDVGQARKQVLSLILANHSDRCLTCHRREHCHPGDICLRDDVVTHRCVTCPKNYRCELQATCEVVGMAKFEPWEGEARSFYASPEHPPADRANPFLEFDPKMCIICTRCVRACDELRHTGAITLAGRGFSTRIAFGAGGRVDESNCDFCGACIDVCPTATLLEHPHKWISRPDEWVETVCSYCSVGCTIKLGVKDGRGVMVRPSTVNPVSQDQICVRGRYHYDALKAREYLQRPLVRRGDLMAPIDWDSALAGIADRIAAIANEHGRDAIGFLAGPLLVNEEAYTVQKIARAVVGTNNVDFSGGAVARAVGSAVKGAFGTEELPADMTRLRTATHVLVVGDDLEASHPVAALRLKDAVAYNDARLVYVGARWGELTDFAEAWLRPAPGSEAQAVTSLVRALLAEQSVRDGLSNAGVGGVQAAAGGFSDVNGTASLAEAVAVFKDAIAKGEEANVAVVFAPTHVNAWQNADTAKAAANLAIVACGPERAPASLYVMPTDVNVNGLRGLGVTPELLPGYHPLADGDYRGQAGETWGGVRLSQVEGLTLQGMLAAARNGKLKALVITGDNPMLAVPDKAAVRAALEALDLIVVIDNVMTDTAELAEYVLPDVDVYGKAGTYTPADRRILRRSVATGRQEQARPAIEALAELGTILAARLGRSVTFSENPEAVMSEIAAIVPAYNGVRYIDLIAGDRRQDFNGAVPANALQSVTAAEDEAPVDVFQLALMTGRTLYTSIEATAIHKPDADKLHREEFVEVSLEDAERLGIADGDEVTLATDQGEMRIRAQVTDMVPAGSVFVPLLYNGGEVTSILPAENGATASARVRLKVPAVV
jgi:predicted molibdopterin-dependent oxidoreductase YjgC